ncbi:hypothetical protein [Ekhidna sp.]|uniref:hypothetical protein n=1 Tax=Ekhidna sp. TaxID=2608089 RepID=UPI003CCC0596
MDDELNKLKSQWKEVKASTKSSTLTIDEVREQARKKKRNVRYSHYGNMSILIITLIIISLFFYHVTPFQDLLSKIGVALMIGGLALRILIEWVSVVKSKQIDSTHEALKNINSALKFYKFRKKIHGPITVTIVSLYTLGFYMLTPEFSKYIELHWMIIMDVGYVIGALILITQIRKKGIKVEMNDLEELIELKNEITATETQA